MTRLIKDLIQEATGYKIRVYEMDGVRTLGEREEFFDKEKFAKLIIKHCIHHISLRKDIAIDNGWNVDEAMSMAILDIEDQFGVEE